MRMAIMPIASSSFPGSRWLTPVALALSLAGYAFAQPANNPTLWLQADSLVQADGSPVSIWPDSSGNAFHATNGIAANQPLFRLNILAGKPVVHFNDDGSTATANPNVDYLVSPLNWNGNSNDFTAFIVFRANVVGVRDTLIQPLGAGTTVLYVETNATPATNFYSFASSQSLVSTSRYSGAVWTIAAVEQDTVSKTLRIYRDGQVDAATTIGTNAAPSSGGWLFGCNKPLTGNGLSGDIAEILIYPRVLSAPERHATDSYLAAKYSLPVWQPVLLDQIGFHKATYSNKYGTEGGSIDGGGTMFVFVRNQSTTTQTITNLVVNGVGVTGISNFKWWRVWPQSIPPNGTATITVKANGSPLTEGASVSNFVQFASGETASAAGVLATSTLRIGSVVPSQDQLTLNLYLRNLDTASYTINSVLVDTDVTAQATFVGGATIAPSSVGIVKVAYSTALSLLSDHVVRVVATKAGGGQVMVGAPVKIIEPTFPIGTWSGSMADVASKQQFARSNLLGMVAGVPNCCQMNTMADTYDIRAVTFAWDTNGTPDPSQIVPNIGSQNVRAWFIRDEPDINSHTSAEMAAAHLAFATTDSTHPTYMNLASNRKFNEFGQIPDIVGMDHYAAYSAPSVIPNTWITRASKLEEALDYVDVLKANTEPKRMWVWPQGVAGTWSTQPKDWAIDMQFWMSILGGTKGYFWFTYKEEEQTVSASGYAAMQGVTRRLSQVRNLLLYGEVSDNVALSAQHMIARSIVSEEAVVVTAVNVNYSTGTFPFSPSYSLSSISGTLTIPVPAWLQPVAQVYEVTETGSVPVSYTTVGSSIQINASLGNTAATCSKVYVIGRVDTQAPGQPTRLKIAEARAPNSLVLSWREPADNFGVMGYRVYSNNVQIADVSAPIVVAPAVQDAALGSTDFTIKAYDAAGNLGPASAPVRYAKWDFSTDNYLDGWNMANQIANAVVANGVLSFDITGGDPYMMVVAPNVNGTLLPKAQVRMRNSTSATLAQVFWTTAADPNYDGAKSLLFPINANDTGFTTYTIDLSGLNNWVGQTITGFRLDPVANANSGHMDIDWIALANPPFANQPPSFTKGANQSVLENAGPQTVANWATAISPGPPSESGQTVTFIVSNNNTALFSAQPAVSSSGTLTYTPATNVCGAATVSVQAHDDGGTANGGQDTSAAQTFTITVTCVNQAPSFSKGPDINVNENSGAVTVTNWAANISPGPPNEAGQGLSFTVTNGNNALFSAQPAISSTRTLTFTPAANAFGAAVVGVRLFDSGGTANGGQNASGWQTFNLTVNPVNHPPVFTKGADQRIATNAGPQTIVGWAKGISAGPANENAQTLTFLVTNSNPALFSVQPAIDPAGTLTYTAVPGVTGGATAWVQLKDNGGTNFGGRDVSALLSFTITVTPTGGAPASRGGPPNLILIYTDDLGYGDAGVYNQNARFTNGLPAVRTPVMDRLAAEGLRFTQFYASPWCAPSRASLMTGLHNGHISVRGNPSTLNLRRDIPIIPELLHAGGYVNGAFGKWGLGESDEVLQSPTVAGQVAVGDSFPNRKGFDEFFGYLSHLAAHFSYAQELYSVLGYRLWDTYTNNLVAIEPPATYTQDLFAQRALDFIQRHRANRFFLYLPFTPPHANSYMGRMDAPEIEPEYFDKTWPDTEKKFASIITRMDRHIGLIMDKLVELGLDQDTVVILTSDNGAHAAGGHDYTFFNSTGPLRDKKFSVYDGGIRVPFVARWPGHINAGTVSTQVAACWDLMPTICELAGVPCQRGIDGVSILPTLLSNTNAQAVEPYFYWENNTIGRAVRAGDWKGVKQGAAATELYNLAADIGEANNVAAANPMITTQMDSLLQLANTAPYVPAPAVLSLTPPATGVSNLYLLSLGATPIGDAPVAASFCVSNAASGYAELLSGDLTPLVTDPRLSVRPTHFGPLVAGGTSAPVTVSFNPSSSTPMNNQSAVVSGYASESGFPPVTNHPLTLSFGVSLLAPRPWPISGISADPISGTRLDVMGVPGLVYNIQASTNLTNWDLIGNGIVNSNGFFHFLDTNTPVLPQRFFRSTWP